MAPCGVFCGACPSFEKTCLGCASESRDQQRTSKWSCKIRRCCYETEENDYCIECGRFPCKEYRRKLLDSHPGEPKFKYRHEVSDNFKKMQELGSEDYLAYQQRRWTCPSCGGTVHFYHYKCSACGRDVDV